MEHDPIRIVRGDHAIEALQKISAVGAVERAAFDGDVEAPLGEPLGRQFGERRRAGQAEARRHRIADKKNSHVARHIRHLRSPWSQTLRGAVRKPGGRETRPSLRYSIEPLARLSYECRTTAVR